MGLCEFADPGLDRGLPDQALSVRIWDS